MYFFKVHSKTWNLSQRFSAEILLAEHFFRKSNAMFYLPVTNEYLITIIDQLRLMMTLTSFCFPSYLK